MIFKEAVPVKVRKAVIPAAGFGTRMLPATKAVPKEMLPVSDKPVIQYVVEEIVTSGIEEILIITSRGKNAMEDFFDYSPELEERLKKPGKEAEYEAVRRICDMADITFIRQKELRGLGHAVSCARSFVGNEPFAVLSGDDIMVSDVPVTAQLIRAAEKYSASAVGIQYVEDRDISKYSSVKGEKLEDRIMSVTDMNEKPTVAEKLSNYAILGRYVLTPGIFDALDETKPGYGGEIQLTDALRVLCSREKMVGVEYEARRYDAGNLCGYLEATIDLSLQNPACADWLREFIKKKAQTL